MIQGHTYKIIKVRNRESNVFPGKKMRQTIGLFDFSVQLTLTYQSTSCPTNFEA